ncbi:MAG: SBBP repeat-containing protein [Candidatus Aminicenantes bacterium]|nr:MAG: SBBP repeat-containing protein [Candidatus Aminicenantes bacterium]
MNSSRDYEIMFRGLRQKIAEVLSLFVNPLGALVKCKTLLSEYWMQIKNMVKLLLKVSFLAALLISLSFQNSTTQIQNHRVETRQSFEAHEQQIRSHDSSKGAKLDLDYGKIPLYFIPNRGQVHETACFYAKASWYTLWLTKEGLVFDSNTILKRRNPDSADLETKNRENPDDFSCERDISRLAFLDSSKNPDVVPIFQTGHRVNYFIGSEKSKWRTNIPTSRGVLYRELYKNIDLKVYGSERKIEYDYIIRPGGKVSDIKFEYRNVKNTKIDEKGNLLIETEFGEFVHRKPQGYQEIEEKKVGIEAHFHRITKNTYEFKIEGYNKKYELIIDPVVSIDSTYLGGLSHDYGHGIAVDSEGAIYVSGSTRSTDFPVQNPAEAGKEGMSDVFITKLNSSGDALVYSTYLGGSDDELLFFGDYGCGIAVDSEGAVYVTGDTESTDFPTQTPFQESKAEESDVFITKLSSSGDSIAYSTYLGGSSLDYSKGIAVDSSGNAYVTGNTFSPDFPTYSPIQENKSDGWDAFVTKINSSGSGLVYSTYLGGSNHDYSHGIVLDSEGAAYVTGDTFSSDFPTQNPIQASNAGLSDVFITKVNSSGITLEYSTYLGGFSHDYGNCIDVDSTGAAYVTGSTRSTDFPLQNPIQESNAEGWDAFVAKISSLGDAFLYSTYLGGSGHDHGHGIAVDSAGAAYVTGSTMSIDFPTQSAIYDTYAGGELYDSFISKVNSSGDVLSFSTYLGGSADDYGKGLVIDSSGAACVTGYTHSTDFPTKNPLYGTQAGECDVFIAKVSSAYSLSINAGANGTTNPVPGIYTHDAGAEVTIEATANQGYSFNSWTGDVPSGHESDNPLTVTMDSDKSITANFTGQYTLVIATTTGGTTTPAPGTHSYGEGAVTITATPSQGYRFNGWTGDVPSGYENDNPLTVTMDSDKSITANFIRQYTLTLASTEGGSIDPSAGTHLYDEGAEATITAAPSQGYRFSGWTGDVPSGYESDNPLTVTMDSDRSITANFIRQYTLTLASTEGGSIDPSAGAYLYDEGTEVTITAAPSQGYRFSGWTGDVPSGQQSDNPLTVTMDSDRSITANFIRQYTLTLASTEGGTTDPSPGTHLCDEGTEITVKAIPDIDYKFSGWSGDASGEDNPIIISMDSDKTVTANFTRIIYPPLNFAGQKISNRALFYIEFINELSWNANPKNADADIAKYRIYQVDGGSRSQLVELDADTFKYYHRNIEQSKTYVYILVAVASDGNEGESTSVTVL